MIGVSSTPRKARHVVHDFNPSAHSQVSQGQEDL